MFNKLISNQQDPFEDQSTRAGKKEVRATSAIKVGVGVTVEREHEDELKRPAADVGAGSSCDSSSRQQCS